MGAIDESRLHQLKVGLTLNLLDVPRWNSPFLKSPEVDRTADFFKFHVWQVYRRSNYLPRYIKWSHDCFKTWGQPPPIALFVFKSDIAPTHIRSLRNGQRNILSLSNVHILNLFDDWKELPIIVFYFEEIYSLLNVPWNRLKNPS